MHPCTREDSIAVTFLMRCLQILGAYCSTDWAERKKVEKKNLQYFGTGETFLFTLAPKRVRFYPRVLVVAEWFLMRMFSVSRSQ